MEFTSFEEHIRHQFDAFCKKVLKFKARDIYKQYARQAAQESSFSEIPDTQLSHVDEYFTDTYQFKALDFDVAVKDELMAEALAMLPEDRRRIVLLYYFLGMNTARLPRHWA